MDQKTKTSSREPTRYVVRMVCAKARVTSVRGTTAPRSEMEDFHAITPNDLLLQRSKNTVPGVVYGTDDSITRRQEAMRELEEMWWNMWIVQALPHIVPYKRWKTEHRSLCIGYIVLMLYEKKVGKDTYRLGRVISVHPDSHGVVRTITVGMRRTNKREKLLPYQPKPLVEVKRVVVICPVI